jgi:hypothetical protein
VRTRYANALLAVGDPPLNGAVRRMSGYLPRLIGSTTPDVDADGVKLYTISAQLRAVDETPYLVELARLKKRQAVTWRTTPAFAIFHDGSTASYLVLAWWGNDNELFTRVSVREEGGWASNADRYSFCLWDMEVMWFERAAFIKHIYTSSPDIRSYRAARPRAAGSVSGR